MSEAFVLSTLQDRAGLQPDDLAFTYVDYDEDWAGKVEDVTWSQLFRRTQNLAREIAKHGTTGDRAVILAPQGMEYIVAFLGSMLAGFIAVPLPLPFAGSHDERVSAVIADTSPTVVLTTSSSAGIVNEYVGRASGAENAAIIEVDSLDLEARGGSRMRIEGLPEIAYLQYTSGSTRTPAGVVITHANLETNFRQLMSGFFPETSGIAPPDTHVVSWLPFYHDMGLVEGVVCPILGGYHGHLSSPMSFLQRPARWIQALGAYPHTWTAAPNFALELSAAKVPDEDMAGVDLSGLLGLTCGAERIHPGTLKRFADRFTKYGFNPESFRPSYGLAEATVFVATRTVAGAPKIVNFDSEGLSADRAERCEAPAGIPLISYGTPESPLVRIVDPETLVECPEDKVGEIWVTGANVAEGYWNKPELSEKTFGGMLPDPSPGTPAGPWLRTGDLGFFTDGEMYIVGRMKDLLIIRGRNHYPEDIEATVSEISRGRVAAIAVTAAETEKLVLIVEYKKPRSAAADIEDAELHEAFRNDVTAAIASAHGVNASDLVLVAPGSIPTTTSGKIRRAACGDLYLGQQFTRLGS